MDNLTNKLEMHNKILDFLQIKLQSLMDKWINTEINLVQTTNKHKLTEEKCKI